MAASADAPASGFRAGAAAAAPVLVTLVPFGLLAGASAVDSGLTPAQAAVGSLTVFSATAQIAAYEMLGAPSTLLPAVAVAALLNARFLLLGVALAPHLASQPLHRRLLAGYLLTTQTFAVVAGHVGERGGSERAWRYYLGAAVPVWFTYQAATIAGVVLGAAAGRTALLAFAVPLSFLVLLVPLVRTVRSMVTATTAGAVALLASPLPAGMGTVLAVVTGVSVAMLIPAAPVDGEQGLS